jgi:hypothetical protein
MINNPFGTIPRVRAKHGQSIDDDKWYVELSIWDITGVNQIGEPFILGPYEDQKTARTNMREASQLVAQELEKKITGQTSGQYIDFKNGGVLRSWDEN